MVGVSKMVILKWENDIIQNYPLHVIAQEESIHTCTITHS